MEKNEDYDVGRRFFMTKKLIFCILLVSFSMLSGKAQEKEGRVTLSLKDVTLQEVFKEITRQTGYQFVYSSSRMVTDNKISVTVKNETLENTLEQCLKGTNLGFKVEEGHVIISPKLHKAESDVRTKIYKGMVFDQKGEQMPGVTVVLKGTRQGVSTDLNGNFEIAIPEGMEPVLVFSFVGMKTTEMKLRDQKSVRVMMEEEINEMDEVVVNGLFTQNKNSYTGSVSTIKGEDLLRISQTNIFQGLAALTPGLRIVENNAQGSNPNHIPEIIIRGTTSLASQGELGLNRPLIMMDGVEITMEQLYDMDIFEIERVDVLKDASATAMYGDRAANGVIVVQRKRVTDSKLRLRYNFVPNVQFPDVSSFNLCSPEEKLELERLYGEYDYVTGEKDMEYNRKLQLIKSGVNTDWKSKPLRNSWSFNHSLTMTGRGGGLDYSVSLRYGDTRGVMKGDFRQNYGVSFYFSYTLANRVNLNFRSDWTETDAKDSPYGSFSDFVRINPYDVPKDEYGEWVKELSFGYRNPLYDASTNSFSKSTAKNFQNMLSARWDIMKNFYATGSFAYTLTDAQSDSFDSPESTTWRGQEYETSPKGSYSIAASKGHNWSVNYALNYSKLFGKDQTSMLSLHGGGTATKNKRSHYAFAGIGFLKPEFNDLSYASSYPNSHPSGEESVSTTVGWYANLNFIYDNRYFVDGSFRSSGGSNYGTDKLYSPYWSFGIGWNAQNESFLKDTWVNLLRFRGSLGYVGSGNFGGVKPVTIYKYDPENTYDKGLGTIPVSMGNDQLRSQRTLSWNGGVALSVLDGRFDANVDYYRQVSKDLLLAISLPPSSGITSVMANLGESVNWGLEWSVSAKIINKPDMFWRITINGHHTENKIKKISNSLKRQSSVNRDSVFLESPKIQLEEGESQDAIYAVRSKGIDPASGREIYIKKDGSYTFEFDSQDKVAVGCTVPKMEGSIVTSFGWKGFSVNATLSYTWGGDIYNSTRATKIENINYKENVDRRAFTERWKKPGDVVDYIIIGHDYGYQHSERFVERKNELYLSSLGFSYDINPQWVRKIGLKKLMVGVTLSDICRLSTVKFERGTSYPYMRGFNFTISPTF